MCGVYVSMWGVYVCVCDVCEHCGMCTYAVCVSMWGVYMCVCDVCEHCAMCTCAVCVSKCGVCTCVGVGVCAGVPVHSVVAFVPRLCEAGWV